jgi:hypothetical protein
VCRAEVGDVPPDTDEDWPDLNYVWTRMRLEPLHFERLMKAVAHIRHELGSHDMSLSQCLMAMADRVLAEESLDPSRSEDHELDPGRGEEREQKGEQVTPTQVCSDHAPPVRIIAHRCPSCERAWTETPSGPLELDRRDREALESDAETIAGDDSAGTPGHISRTIPPATRRAVLIRDRGRCQVPGCRCKQHLALHHILFRSQGGSHHPDNLVTLCWAHHDMLHRGVLKLTYRPDGALRWERGHGEALGLRVSIQGDRAELDHAALSDFEGPSASWYALATYFGPLEPLEVDAPRSATHVCREVGQGSSTPPPLPYPRGQQTIRLGDEQRMAPRWMFRNLRV